MSLNLKLWVGFGFFPITRRNPFGSEGLKMSSGVADVITTDQ